MVSSLQSTGVPWDTRVQQELSCPSIRQCRIFDELEPTGRFILQVLVNCLRTPGLSISHYYATPERLVIPEKGHGPTRNRQRLSVPCLMGELYERPHLCMLPMCIFICGWRPSSESQHATAQWLLEEAFKPKPDLC